MTSVIFEGNICNSDDITDHIMDISTIEFCNNSTEVLISETTARILNIIIQQINNDKDCVDKIDKEKIILLYRKVFVEKFPITRQEYNYLREFFNKKELLPKINQILAKIVIQQSDDNKIFIRNYLENNVSKKYDASKVIFDIQDEIGWDPFVVDIDLKEGEIIQLLRKIDGGDVFYSYKDTFGKFKIFLVKENKKIIYLEEEFENKPESLSNRLIFGVEMRGKGNEGNWLNIDQSINEIESNGGNFSQIGIFYTFDSKSNKLEQVYYKERIVSVKELDPQFAFFQTTNKDEKKGVIKIVETDTGKWETSEILQELYDKIYMGPEGFIVTERDDDNEFQNNSIITGIHMEVWNDNVYPEEKLIGKTLLGILGNKWRLTWLQLEDFKSLDQVDFYHINGNLIGEVRSTEGYNYYFLNKNEQIITPIKGLQGLQNSLQENFFEGIPAFIRENGKRKIKVFDQETKTIKSLLEMDNDKILPEFHITREIIELDCFPKGKIYYRFHEGKLYGIKKGFDIINGNIHKNQFLRISKDLSISFYENFDKISSYLEEIRTPTTVKI